MNLKTLRELKGISRKELAEQTGISFRSIQDYEQGHKDLSSAKAETILRIAKILDCSMEDLISEVDFSELKPSELESEEFRMRKRMLAEWKENTRRERMAARDGDDATPSTLAQTEAKGATHSGADTSPMVFRLHPEDEQAYILMHREDAVAALVMEPVTGTLISVSEVYDRALLPIGAGSSDGQLKAWWQRRAVPVTQGDMGRILDRIGLLTPQVYLLKNMGLSMSDDYWVKPADRDAGWREVNLFQNDFDDVIGASQFAGLDALGDFRDSDLRSPSASTQGNVPKAWISVEGGRRFLVKGSEHGRTQQIFNEVVAAYIHRKQNRFPYVDYQFYTIDYGHGKQLGVSSEAFTDEQLEFIPAADIIRAGRQHDHEASDYELFLRGCVQHGLKEEELRAFLDYQILTDFVITNVDRNYGNFGVLRDAESLEFVKPAPIFDSGNSMFYDLDMRSGTLELKNIRVDSFAMNEAGLLRLVQNPDMVDMNKLLTNEELSQVLASSNRSPEEIKLLIKIYERKKDLLFKLKKGDTNWMK